MPADERQGEFPLPSDDSPWDAPSGRPAPPPAEIPIVYPPADTDVARLSGADTPITSVARISEKRVELLRKLGVTTLGECLENYPRDYLDRTRMTAIGNAGSAGDVETV
ncbi:hypothetical protein CMK11_00875, partial [Candidatus Poribacteria bacterium]|nr:hypothetical protein [Candidatus Poribacteria bacterium]